MTSAFLTADWRNALLANFEIEPNVLSGIAPNGTEVATFSDKAFVSLVAFQFHNTRVRGIPIPYHRHFEEVNLRFYVRRKHAGCWRRGVVFVKELVPRRAVAWTARVLYNENYIALPMSHTVEQVDGVTARAAYTWRFQGRDHSMSANVCGAPRLIPENSPEEFFAHHEWGYVRNRRGQTVEYRVDHSRWHTAPVENLSIEGEFAALYGPSFADAISVAPYSALFAVGSAVTVYRGRIVTP